MHTEIFSHVQKLDMHSYMTGSQCTPTCNRNPQASSILCTVLPSRLSSKAESARLAVMIAAALASGELWMQA